MTDVDQQNDRSSQRLRWIWRKLRHLRKQLERSQQRHQRGWRILDRIATLHSMLSIRIVPRACRTRTKSVKP
jgi:hypothetical protein